MKKKLGWILSLALCFALMIAATLVTASASASVSYIDANGDEQTCASATVVTETNTAWGASDSQEHWYVVTADAPITIGQRITVTGDNSLTIYGQSVGEGMGKLTANAGWERAAIGSEQFQAAGNITICGGNITAAGGESAAIGNVNGEAGTVTIYGGWVKATGAYTDADSVSSWAEPAMRWAVENGIITGVTESTLVPQGTATRAQCAAMLMRFVEL